MRVCMTLLAALLLAITLHAADGGTLPPLVLRVAAQEQDPPLDKTAFRAVIESSPTGVSKLLGPKDDMVVVLVLDLTGDISRIDTARGVIAERLQELPANTWVAVVKSQDVLQVLVDPTPDRQKVLTAIQEYGVTGKAGLLDTLEPAVKMGDLLLRQSNVRVAVVYLTDSNVYNSRGDFTNPVINASDAGDLSRRFPDQLIKEKMGKLSDALAGFQAPLFFVHLNYYSDPINEALQRGLLQLAEESGGTGAFCRSAGDIPGAVEKVLTSVQQSWSIGVEVPPTVTKSATVHLFNGDREVPSHSRFSLRK